MRKIQIGGKIEKGSLSLNAKEFIKLCKLLEEGDCVVTVETQAPPKTIEEYRQQYFAMRDVVAEESGNSKADIHEEAKNKFLAEEGNTTKHLNEVGWYFFIKRFKSWAFEHFNVYI